MEMHRNLKPVRLRKEHLQQPHFKLRDKIVKRKEHLHSLMHNLDVLLENPPKNFDRVKTNLLKKDILKEINLIKETEKITDPEQFKRKFEQIIEFKKNRVNRIREKEFLIKQIKIMLSWSDEIPKKILHSDDAMKSPKYKVRKNWFQNVVFILGMFSANEYIVKNFALNKKINNYIKTITNGEFTKRLTTKEDIETANNLLKEVLENLEN